MPPLRRGGAPKGPQSWQGSFPQVPVPWVSWASLTVGLSFLPARLPPMAVPAPGPLMLSFWGGKGCAPLTSNRKGLKGHSRGGTHLQCLEKAQGLLLEV